MSVLQVYFEVKITEELPVDFGDDHTEADPHVVRVGSWENSMVALP